MAEDWAADVKRYVADADDGVIAGIVRYCGIALRKRDSSLVSFSDDKETGRVRENYLKKKLGLTDSDDALNAAIASIGERMKGDNFKNRVTAYYLLADHYGKFDLFRKAGAAAAGAVAAGGAAVAAGGAMGLASLGDGDEGAASAAAEAPGLAEVVAEKAESALGSVAAVGAAAVGAAGLAAAAVSDKVSGGVSAAADAVGDGVSAVSGAVGDGVSAVAGAVGSGAAAVTGAVGGGLAAASAGVDRLVGGDDDDASGGWGWLWWLLIGLLALLALWWLFFRQPAASVDAGAGAVATRAATEGSAAPLSSEAAVLASAPAEGTVAIPAGAGVTSELRDGKPVAKVYFDTAKTDVVPAFAATAAGLKGYLESHAGSSLELSGFNDPRGDAAMNAALSKGRAEAVKAELVKAGIPDASIALVEPTAATDSTVNLAGARRVEVIVK